MSTAQAFALFEVLLGSDCTVNRLRLALVELGQARGRRVVLRCKLERRASH